LNCEKKWINLEDISSCFVCRVWLNGIGNMAWMDSTTSSARVNSLWSLFQKTEGKNKHFDLLFDKQSQRICVNYGNLPNTRFNGNSWTSLKLLVCHFDPNQVYLIHIDIGAILDPIVGNACKLHRRLHFVNKQILWDCLSKLPLNRVFGKLP
jgi:hypothetical protein